MQLPSARVEKCVERAGVLGLDATAMAIYSRGKAVASAEIFAGTRGSAAAAAHVDDRACELPD